MKLSALLEVALAAKGRGEVNTKECFSVGFKKDNDLYIG